MPNSGEPRNFQPVVTEYNGNRFRSRLEARWAALFDLVGLPYIYEPSDHGGYIPDFLIPGPNPLYVEVGPVQTDAEYRAKAAKPLRYLDADFIVLGTDPLARMMDTPMRSESSSIIGLQFQRNGFAGEEQEFDNGCEAHLCRDHNGHVAIVNLIMSYTPYPCGCGDHSGWWGYACSAAEIEHLWAQAGTATQWKSDRIIIGRLG